MTEFAAPRASPQAYGKASSSVAETDSPLFSRAASRVGWAAPDAPGAAAALSLPPQPPLRSNSSLFVAGGGGGEASMSMMDLPKRAHIMTPQPPRALRSNSSLTAASGGGTAAHAHAHTLPYSSPPLVAGKAAGIPDIVGAQALTETSFGGSVRSGAVSGATCYTRFNSDGAAEGRGRLGTAAVSHPVHVRAAACTLEASGVLSAAWAACQVLKTSE